MIFYLIDAIGSLPHGHTCMLFMFIVAILLFNLIRANGLIKYYLPINTILSGYLFVISASYYSEHALNKNFR